MEYYYFCFPRSPRITIEPSHFFRANRAQLINTRAIANVAEWFNGGLQVTLASGEKIEISRRQAALFRKLNGL